MKPIRTSAASSLAFVVLVLMLISIGSADDTPQPFQPKQGQLPVAPPEGAVVLFDGTDEHQFVDKHGKRPNWPITEGTLVSTADKARSNHIASKVHFRDADIHVEFMLPEKGVGNSGVYIHGNYELQILNSHGKKLDNPNGMGAIYGFAPPLTSAARKPSEWQVYDIRYRAPRRDKEGKIVEQGSITAWLNGEKVQGNTRFGEPRSSYHPYRYRTTDHLRRIWQRQKETSVGPVFLQDHDAPVRFRNVWIKPLDDKAGVYEAQAKEE